jgi:hypothetical protein
MSLSFDEDTIEKLAETLRAAANQEEVFGLVNLLLAEIPEDWVDKEENWLLIADRLEQYGETDYARLFKLANQCAFRLSMKR